MIHGVILEGGSGMRNATRFAGLAPVAPGGVARGDGSAGAGGKEMGGTGLYFTHSVETLAPGAVRVGAFGQLARSVAFTRRVVIPAR